MKITKDMLDLAKHIVEQKSTHFKPDRFEDRYEAALTELLNKKQAGQPIAAAKKQAPSNVVNLMDALRASIKGGDNPSREKLRELKRSPRSVRQADAGRATSKNARSLVRLTRIWRMPWRAVIRPARKLARRGFVSTARWHLGCRWVCVRVIV
jgi:hypothetical protein